MTSWIAQPDAVMVFSRYCAPTAIADLLDCSRVEAAELLMAEGLAHERVQGSVCGFKWNEYLKDLGLERVDTRRPIAEREALVAERRAKGGWEPGQTARYVDYIDRWGWERAKTQYAPTTSDRTIKYDTVAQWLRKNPTATGILNVQGHTLAVRDGKVSADSMTSKSQRRRVEGAFLLPR